jgi:hypothetical protein
MEYIEAMEYEIPDRDTIFRLIACLGVDSIFKGNWGNDKPTESISSYSKINVEPLDADVWKKLTDKILNDLKQGQSGPIEARWPEAEIISQIIKFDLDKAFEKAVEALPDPKAWKELELQEQLLAEAKKQVESAA